MLNDIVERLRGQRTNSVLCDEAADEIERLRARLEEVSRERDRWMSQTF
jgi:hypothetical protein